MFLLDDRPPIKVEYFIKKPVLVMDLLCLLVSLRFCQDERLPADHSIPPPYWW